MQSKENIAYGSPEKRPKNGERSADEIGMAGVQVTDLDEEETKSKETSERTCVTNVSKRREALNYAAALKELNEYFGEAKTSVVENVTTVSSESHTQESNEVKQHHYNQKQKSIKTVLKRTSKKSYAVSDFKVTYNFI